MTRCLFLIAHAVFWLLLTPSAARAQRTLHWDNLAVQAHLAADGVLHIAETQTMVFSGDWNGGERRFDIRSRQTLSSIRMERVDASGARHEMTYDSSLDDVDDFAMTDSTTVRWRSRLPTDPPFRGTRLTYVLHYELGNIVQTDGTSYRIAHDFAFAERDEDINRVEVRLTLDPAWQPEGRWQEAWTGGPLPPGDGFVLTIPLAFNGAQTPAVIDTRRPPEVVQAIQVLFIGAAAVTIVFFLREQAIGRFARLPEVGAAEPWLQQEILDHPAEVIGAAWDENVGTAEVVSLLARLEAEGKLQTTATGKSMRVRLLTSRGAFKDYEAALISGLFFRQDLTETSTDMVRKHYKATGFNPVTLVQDGIQKRRDAILPKSRIASAWSWLALVLFLAGTGLLAVEFFTGDTGPVPFVAFIGACVVAALLQIPGVLFYQRMHWGRFMALLCMLPAWLVVAGVAAFLWRAGGPDGMGMPPYLLAGVTVMALWCFEAALSGMASRGNATAIAYRKRLTAAREFFRSELEKPAPILRDAWYPWILAFDLGSHADEWTTRFGGAGEHRSHRSSDSISSGSSTWSGGSGGAWTGAGGGRSGGGGGGAAWSAAAASMAAGVSPPSSSSSGGGGGSSSGGGSSGGGGGGGW